MYPSGWFGFPDLTYKKAFKKFNNFTICLTHSRSKQECLCTNFKKNYFVTFVIKFRNIVKSFWSPTPTCQLVQTYDQVRYYRSDMASVEVSHFVILSLVILTDEITFNANNTNTKTIRTIGTLSVFQVSVSCIARLLTPDFWPLTCLTKR